MKYTSRHVNGPIYTQYQIICISNCYLAFKPLLRIFKLFPRKPDTFVASCSRSRHSQPSLNLCSCITLILIYFKLCAEVLALMIIFRVHWERRAATFISTFLIRRILYLAEIFPVRSLRVTEKERHLSLDINCLHLGLTLALSVRLMPLRLAHHCQWELPVTSNKPSILLCLHIVLPLTM